MFLFPGFLFNGVLFMRHLLSSPILYLRFGFFIWEILIIFLIKIAEMRIIWIFILLYSYFLKFIHKKWKKILFPFEATFWKDLRIYCFYPIFIISKKLKYWKIIHFYVFCHKKVFHDLTRIEEIPHFIHDVFDIVRLFVNKFA